MTTLGAMNIGASDLTGQFGQLTDEELLSRCGSGMLTDVANVVALQEIDRRGLYLSPWRAVEDETPEYAGDFALVARFLNPTEAYLACSCLEAAGVSAFVADANVVQTNSLWAAALGGARLLVPIECLAEAKEVMKALDRGDFALSDDDERII